MPPRPGGGLLTAKEEAFALAYVETGTSLLAYKAAYDTSRMAHKTISSKGAEVLARPRVQIRIAVLRATREALEHERFLVTKERVLAEYAKIGFANMLDYVRPQPDGLAYVDLSKLTREQAAAIAGIEVEEYAEGTGEDARAIKRVKFKLIDKRAALADMARHLGMFKESVELTGKDGAPLVPENTTSRELARAILDILREARMENKEPSQ